jgi:hypothetical protein
LLACSCSLLSASPAQGSHALISAEDTSQEGEDTSQPGGDGDIGGSLVEMLSSPAFCVAVGPS